MIRLQAFKARVLSAIYKQALSCCTITEQPDMKVVGALAMQPPLYKVVVYGHGKGFFTRRIDNKIIRNEVVEELQSIDRCR